MNYELAKKLKDAGFPQVGKGKLIWFETQDLLDKYPDEEQFYIPTLSELIEACNNDASEFILRRRVFDIEDWMASKETGICVVAPSPEEAVANLWLELNKKI